MPDHLQLEVVAHPRLLEVLAEDAVDEPDGREVLDAGESGGLHLVEEAAHHPEGVRAVDPREHRRVLDDGEDFVGHLHDDRVGVPVGQQPGERAPAGHAETARVVDDQQVDSARFGGLGRYARARAAADDRAALGDFRPESGEYL